jgi:hypothetical protein
MIGECRRNTEAIAEAVQGDVGVSILRIPPARERFA